MYPLRARLLPDSSANGGTPLTRPARRIAAGALLLASTTSWAQPVQIPLVIRNVRIITMTGETIENGSILIKGEQIEVVGREVKAPLLARTEDLRGKTVTPGFIDSWSALGHLGGSGQADPTSTAWDAFDRYARDDLREALRHGVTTLYVGPRGGPGISGTGVLVQLLPGTGGSAGELLTAGMGLHVNLGSNQNAGNRMKTFDDVRKQFRKALDYRQALEDYDADLKEYLEKLKERRDKNTGAENAGSGETGKADEPKKDEKAPQEKPKTTAADAQSASWFAGGEEKKEEPPKSGEGEKKDDKLAKPTRPAPDRKSEAILKAVDHQLPVRIEAHRSEDILNALELTREFNLDVIIEGGTDAYMVAGQLAAANVPVVLGPVSRTDLFERNEFRRHTEGNAAALTKAGVKWTIGSGAADPLAARFVGFNAQVAEQHGAAVPWMRAVTTTAADLLGKAERLGRIAPGMRADLVVWTGDPGDPASSVDRVYVAGKPAYVAPQAQSTSP